MKLRPPHPELLAPSATLVGVLAELPPGRYRAVLNVTRITVRRGKETAAAVAISRVVDFKVSRRRRRALEAIP